MNAEATQSYGTMLAETILGQAKYTPAELAAAARRDAGLPPNAPIHIFTPADEPPTGRSEYHRCLELDGTEVLPGGVIRVPGCFFDGTADKPCRRCRDCGEHYS